MPTSQSVNASLLDPASDPFVGTDYRMVSLIGSGGMADVFVVEHRKLSMTYAAKLLRPTFASDKRTVDRMRLEADALAKLDHENIVQIHAYRETSAGLPFIVMDLLQGKTLREALTEGGPGRFPIPTALIFGLDLLNGLHAVHQLGIVHRDLKPSNLFIHFNKQKEYVLKLLDFGGARVIPGLSEDSPDPLAIPTRTGTTVGTPMFMSPEAATGRPIDVRTDIYAAANMIYLMLTGRGPFDDAGSVDQMLHAHATKQPPPLSNSVPGPIPPALVQAVSKGLEKDPDRRFQSAHEFGKTIYDILMDHPKAKMLGSARAIASEPQPQFQRPNRAFLAITSRSRVGARMVQALLVLALLVAAIGIGLFLIRKSLGASP